VLMFHKVDNLFEEEIEEDGYVFGQNTTLKEASRELEVSEVVPIANFDVTSIEEVRNECIPLTMSSPTPISIVAASPSRVEGSLEDVVISIRTFRSSDEDAVGLFWYDGFMELVWDFTCTIACYSPLTVAAIAGTVGAVVADDPRTGTIAVLAIAGVTYGFNCSGLLFIDGLCRDAMTKGDMCDIDSHWVKAPHSTFFVAETQAGDVVGSIAVYLGDLTDFEKKKERSPISGETCSVWKLAVDSTYRQRGVARLLMRRAEEWAKENGGKAIELGTGNSKSKLFYNKIGYQLQTGSLTGAGHSIWKKHL
jgi:GNAT superfamily N-acetyltransferase